MSTKQREKIKLLSGLHLDFIESSTVKARVTYHERRDDYDSKWEHVSRYITNLEEGSEEYNIAANGMAQILPDPKAPWRNYAVDNMEEGKAKKEKSDAKGGGYWCFRDNYEKDFFIPKDEKVLKEFVKAKVNREFFVPILDIPRLKTAKSQIAYTEKIVYSSGFHDPNSYKELALSRYGRDCGTEIFATLEEFESEDTPLGVSNEDYFRNHKFKGNLINQSTVSGTVDTKDFQLAAAWFITLNHFMSFEDEKTPLKDFIENKDFVEKVTAHFNNMYFVRNGYTDELKNALFYKPGSLFYFSNISGTIKARDLISELTAKDVKKVFSALEYKRNPTGNLSAEEESNFKKILISFNNKTRNKSDKIVQWVKDVKADKESLKNAIGINDAEKYIAYVESKTISSLFANVDTENVDDTLAKVLHLSMINSMKRDGVWKRGIETSLFLDILNLLGKDFILNEIKFSQLAVLIDGYFLQRIVLTRKENVTWIPIFFKYALDAYGNNTEGKHRTLDLLYRILMDVARIEFNLTKIKSKDFYETFDESTPVDFTLNILEVKHASMSEIVGLRRASMYRSLVELHKAGL